MLVFWNRYSKTIDYHFEDVRPLLSIASLKIIFETASCLVLGIRSFRHVSLGFSNGGQVAGSVSCVRYVSVSFC
jgi:hypothetical protein